ncbi:hypothetical protein V866_003060 [Kwoniella sp. B9012]
MSSRKSHPDFMTVQENKRNCEDDHQVSSSTRTSEDGITVIGFDEETTLPTCYAPIEDPTNQDECNDSNIPSFHTYNSPPPYCRPDEVNWEQYNLTSDKMREFGYNHRGEFKIIDEDVRYTEFMVMQAIDTLNPKTIDQVRFVSNFTGRLDLAPRWQYKFGKVASTASQVGEEEETEQGGGSDCIVYG